MIEDDDGHVIETDQPLNDYIKGLRIHDDIRIYRIKTVGPLDVLQVRGYSGHIVVVNTHPFCDHDEEEAAVATELTRQGWRPFSTAFNPESEWAVYHFEPVREARPLTWKATPDA